MEELKNTGLILGDHPDGYVLGGKSPILPEIRNITGDWRQFRSRDEKQNMNPGNDRMHCVTASASNCFEEQANWMLINNLWPQDALKFFTENGYIINGKFETSRRFNAKLSGTTKQGNYFWKVLDSFRKDGIVPDSKWSDDPSYNWDEYYKDIPQELLILGKESLKYFSLLYEIVPTPANPSKYKILLKTSPIQIAVYGGGHAVDNDNIEPNLSYDIFDSYDPYSKNFPANYSIVSAYRSVIYPIKRNDPISIPQVFDKDIVYGESSDNVIKLRKALKLLGWPSKYMENSTYDLDLCDQVFSYQLANISHVFIEMLLNLKGRRVGPRTREVLNKSINGKVL